MADWAETKLATAAAGAVDASTGLTISQGELEQIEVYIPKGHSGLTQFKLFFYQGQVIPYKTGDYLTGDDVRFLFDVSGYPTGGGWIAFGTNNDVFSHSWEITFHVNTLMGGEDELSTPILIVPLQGVA